MNTFNLKVVKIHKDAIVPYFAHPGDAGLDIYSVEEKVLNPGERALIKTGIKIELPRNTEAQMRPRSGLALKHGISLVNSPGTIDEGYRGEIGVIVINHGNEVFKVEKGMKICQMVIKPIWTVNVQEVQELDDTERGTGGFGSTGV